MSSINLRTCLQNLLNYFIFCNLSKDKVINDIPPTTASFNNFIVSVAQSHARIFLKYATKTCAHINLNNRICVTDIVSPLI